MTSSNMYEPPFTITPEISTLLLEAVEAVGGFTATDKPAKPWLRRKMRITTIRSSLAIEGNQLDDDQVLAIVEGKRVIGNKNDIREVNNAAKAYDMLNDLDPFSVDDLLRVHGAMMDGLVKEAGRFRMGNVGVYDNDVLIHAGTPARCVPEVMRELFSWLSRTNLHPLIASSVFHYEFEFIHPFSDGNGRTGRLWHTLLLSKWREQLAWLPIESAILDRQQDYYDAFAKSSALGSCEPFVALMLEVVRDSIDSWMHPKDKRSRRLDDIVSIIEGNPHATYEGIAGALGVSVRTIARDMEELQASGRVSRTGSRKGGSWEARAD